MGYVIVSAVLLAVVALAVRSLWRGRKRGSCCGDCSKCRSCGK